MIVEWEQVSIFFAIVVAVITIIKTFYKPVRTMLDRQELMQSASLASLRSAIVRVHDECMQRGYITMPVYTCIMETYQIYHKMGGNGYIDELVKEITRIHTTRIQEGRG